MGLDLLGYSININFASFGAAQWLGIVLGIIIAIIVLVKVGFFSGVGTALFSGLSDQDKSLEGLHKEKIERWFNDTEYGGKWFGKKE